MPSFTWHKVPTGRDWAINLPGIVREHHFRNALENQRKQEDHGNSRTRSGPVSFWAEGCKQVPDFVTPPDEAQRFCEGVNVYRTWSLI
jgi:hypothetical protein